MLKITIPNSEDNVYFIVYLDWLLFIPNALEFLVGKSEGKTQFLRYDYYTWAYNNKMKLDMITYEVCVLVLC